MSKAKGKQSQRTSQSGSMLFIPEKYRDGAYIAALIIAVILFLSPALFTGGNFNASDNIASASFETFSLKLKNKVNSRNGSPTFSVVCRVMRHY